MAAVNCYLSVTCTATPKSQDTASNPSSIPAQPSPPHPRQTKVILPKKKPMKWTTGANPGEYGGPPSTTKLRKYWGEDEDPLTSDDYIWNKQFMGRMKKLIQDPQENDPTAPTNSPSTPTEEESAGFLCLSRVMSLDSLEVDLTEKLIAPSKVEPEVEETHASVSAPQKWRPAPTRRELKKWDKAAKAATGGSEVLLRETRRPKGDPNILAAQSREQYLKLKNKLQYLTLGVGGIGVLSAYYSYSPQIAASYGAGLLGSLMYIRMLGSSVDSIRTDGARALIKGAVGQPRLLVPVVLVMIYNRWNGLLVPEYGFMQLELIPMLVGFFTYKIATFVQAIEDALTVVERKTEV